MSGLTVLRYWAALLVLLALTTGLAFIPLGPAQLGVSLAIACTKALLVLLLFMELKASSALIRTFAAAGFFWLLIMISLTSADYTHRNDQRVPIDDAR